MNSKFCIGKVLFEAVIGWLLSVAHLYMWRHNICPLSLADELIGLSSIKLNEAL